MCPIFVRSVYYFGKIYEKKSFLISCQRCTGKSFSEALILASTNPQMSSCVHKLFWMSKQKQFVYTTCTELVVFFYWTRTVAIR